MRFGERGVVLGQNSYVSIGPTILVDNGIEIWANKHLLLFLTRIKIAIK